MVYQARRTDSERPLVVKFLPKERRDARAIRRFRDEALAGRLVHHPNVAAVIDDGCTEEGERYLVMERAHGESLGHLIARSRVLSVSDAVSIAGEILAGITAIHASGIVHADIKSDNVIVETGARRSIKLIDFGLARVQFFRDEKTVAPEERWLSGTPEYMAPEIVSGHGACFESDLYAVGIILYEMLTGSTPFAGGKPSEIVQRHVADEVVPPSLRREAGDLPAELDHIVLRALSKEPRARYASATAMSDALAKVRPRFAASSQRIRRFVDRSSDTAPTLAGWLRPH